MARQIHHPSSHANDVREVRRLEVDWSLGQSVDLPCTELPQTKTQASLVSLKNMRNLGGRLVTRSGCKRAWSTQYPVNGFGGSGTSTISGHTRTIAWAATGDATGLLGVGSWIFLDGVFAERIIVRTSNTSMKTRTYETTNSYATITSCAAQDQVNGRWFFKKFKTQILHLGTDLWYSDNKCTAWAKCVRNSLDALPNARSRAIVYNNSAYIGVQNMIFRLDMNSNSAAPIFYRINTDGPTVKPAGGIDVAADCITRYTYTMSRLSGNGERNRNTLGVILECESPPVKWDGKSDYGEYFAKTTDAYSQNITGLTPAYDTKLASYQFHWTHISVYRTFRFPTPNALNPTLKSDPNLHVWVADLPIMHPLTVSFALVGGTVKTVTATKGIFYQSDIGRTMMLAGGHWAVISGVTSPTVAVASDWSVDTLSATIGAFGTCAARSSGTLVRTCSQSGTTLTSADTYWSAADVGKRLVCSDGDELIITAFLTTATVTVNKSATKTAILAVCDYVNSDPLVNVYLDKLVDSSLTTGGDDLKAHGGWVLQNRRYIPFSAGDLILIAGGKFFSGRTGDTVLQYDTIEENFEYLFGYYYGAASINCKAPLMGIKDYGGTMLVYEYGRIEAVPINSDMQRSVDSIGLYYGVVQAQYNFVENIGLGHPSLIKHAEDGWSYFLDQNMRLHKTNGVNMVIDLGEDKYNTKLQMLQPAALLSFDSINGLIIQGTEGISSE